VREVERRVQRWVRESLLSMRAYHVPDPEDVVKLDAMENPFPWPQWMVEEWLATLREVRLNRYPDAGASRLKERLAAVLDLPEGMAMTLGNGSDELIQMILIAVGGPGRSVLAPSPSFVMYRLWTEVLGGTFHEAPLGSGFELDRAVMVDAIARHDPALVFLAYPNNPTGNLFDRDAMRAVIDAADGLVVVDEAYHPYARDSFLPELARHPNLLVLRTLSKLGLAGLRLGVLVGPAEWIEQIDKVRLPYNVGSLTQASAEFALRHIAVLDEQAARIRGERERMAAALAALPGIEVFPSRANFLLFRVPPGRAEAVFGGLRERRILIRNLAGASGPMADCLRVTVGAPEENNAFLVALGAVLEAPVDA